MTTNKIGIIGGTGLYAFKDGVEVLEEIRVTTPFGDPSDLLVRTQIGDTEAIFLPRHGKGHKFLPSEVNYRANIYALKSLGVSWCISVSACGSLREEMAPGDIVIAAQMIDRTVDRVSSFFGEGIIAHVSMADPFCPVLRDTLLNAAEAQGQKSNFKVHNQGTYICMSGPQFSTRAESHMYRSWGADIIGMTNLPEAKLAREAEIAYATMALVTDYDCWKNDGEHVEATDVIKVLHKNTENAQKILLGAIPKLAQLEPSMLASHALDNAIFSDLKNTPKETLEKLKLLLARYLKSH